MASAFTCSRSTNCEELGSNLGDRGTESLGHERVYQSVLLVGAQRVHSGLEESKMILVKDRSIHHDDNGDVGYLASLAQ